MKKKEVAAEEEDDEEEEEQKPEREEEKVHISKDTKKTVDNIDRANEAAVRMEDANKEKKELLDREERMKVEERLGGQTEAGEQKKVETPEDYAEKILAGKQDEK